MAPRIRYKCKFCFGNYVRSQDLSCEQYRSDATTLRTRILDLGKLPLKSRGVMRQRYNRLASKARAAFGSKRGTYEALKSVFTEVAPASFYSTVRRMVDMFCKYPTKTVRDLVLTIDSLRAVEGVPFPAYFVNDVCEQLLAIPEHTRKEVESHGLVNYFCYACLDVGGLDVKRCGHGVYYRGNIDNSIAAPAALVKYLNERLIRFTTKGVSLETHPTTAIQF